MVLIVSLKGDRFYACSLCGAIYEDPGLAGECEASCSLGVCDARITSRAVGWIRKPLGRLRRAP